MNTIYKYPLGVEDTQEILLPWGAQIRAIQAQYGAPCLWAEVDSNEQGREKRRFLTVGTGHAIPEYNDKRIVLVYLGTYQLQGGALVFHVYEITRRAES